MCSLISEQPLFSHFLCTSSASLTRSTKHMRANTSLLIFCPSMVPAMQYTRSAAAAALLIHIFLSMTMPTANAAADRPRSLIIQKYSVMNSCRYSLPAARRSPAVKTATIPMLRSLFCFFVLRRSIIPEENIRHTAQLKRLPSGIPAYLPKSMTVSREYGRIFIMSYSVLILPAPLLTRRRVRP